MIVYHLILNLVEPVQVENISTIENVTTVKNITTVDNITTVENVTISVINVTAYLSSALARWVMSDNFDNNSYYQLQYYLTAFPSYTTTINTSLLSYEVIGLIPMSQYQFQVRVCYDDDHHGDWISTVVNLEQRIRKNLN